MRFSVIPQIARGFAMGTADLVPGVSGGTVALVTGIYERLIRNVHGGAEVLRAILSRDVSRIKDRLVAVEWWWLISLLVGILAAVAALSGVLTRLLDEQPVATAAVFFGLVAGAIVIAWRLLGTVTATTIGLAAVAAAALFALLGLRSSTESTAEKIVTEPLWVFFVAGAIAICAMILPGISGSLILVMIGMYAQVLGAVSERDLVTLAIFVLGCITGLALFSTLLNWMLEHHHDLVIAAMIGLMIGSLRVLWPWPGGATTTEMSLPRDQILVPVLLAIAAFGLVLVVDSTAQRATRSARRPIPSASASSPSANDSRT
jgi:putative membrane protein